MEFNIHIKDYPPAKSEALSVLGQKHSHAGRVVALLEAARAALETGEARDLGSTPLAMEVQVFCPRDRLRSDATNYLGGIAYVLQDKSQRGVLEHLGQLAAVQLFDDDHQLEELHYQWEHEAEPRYRVRLASRRR